MSKEAKPDYGYDRPDFAWGFVVGILVIAAAVTFFVMADSLVGDFVLGLGLPTGLVALWFGFIFLGSKRGKLKQRDLILDAIPWRGDEKVLDVGCGPGLLAIGAAKRAANGKVIGVDVWNESVESRNAPESFLSNARVEGVETRVEVRDMDARKLQFDDSSFDVVLARAVLHHIKNEVERINALREMLRVLKPGGRIGLVLIDFNRFQSYVRAMKESGVSDINLLRPKPSSRANRVFGTVVLVAKKA